MTRREWVASLAGFPAILKARDKRPNFLFFMCDDQRHDALSCAGNRILQTPHMDRLAGEGVRFSQAFVSNSLCSPSRGTIVTGLYSHAHGVTWNTGPHTRLKPGLPTFPTLLQKTGYYTALNGKWHMRSAPEGFDHWSILPGQGKYHDPEMIAGGTRVKMRGYVDDVICDQAINTLERRPTDRPFCLLCWFKAPHRSWEPAQRYEKEFARTVIPEPPTFGLGLEDRPGAIRDSDLQIADMPDFFHMGVPRDASRGERKRLNYQHYVKQYYRVLLGV
ncbi:MAG: sulfatase-like hydrolase/transferase, partial [bacterium]|nr:sulfatase-like hydrolase/transferase [bacterium]